MLMLTLGQELEARDQVLRLTETGGAAAHPQTKKTNSRDLISPGKRRMNDKTALLGNRCETKTSTSTIFPLVDSAF